MNDRNEFIYLLAFLAIITLSVLSAIGLYLGKLTSQEFLAIIMPIVTALVGLLGYERGFRRGLAYGKKIQ